MIRQDRRRKRTRSEEEVDEWAKQDATLCETVGWKIRESKDYIILASSVNSEGQYGEPTKIPKKNIIKTRRIKKI